MNTREKIKHLIEKRKKKLFSDRKQSLNSSIYPPSSSNFNNQSFDDVM